MSKGRLDGNQSIHKGVLFSAPAKMYSKVEKGNWVEMHCFPKSHFYLDILVVDREIN